MLKSLFRVLPSCGGGLLLNAGLTKRLGVSDQLRTSEFVVPEEDFFTNKKQKHFYDETAVIGLVTVTD